MRTFTLILITTLQLCGCAGPEHVSPAEFKRQYAWVGQAQSMHEVCYLGERDGRAYLRVRSMTTANQGKWSERVIFIGLEELDPTFRKTLPEAQAEGVP